MLRKRPRSIKRNVGQNVFTLCILCICSGIVILLFPTSTLGHLHNHHDSNHVDEDENDIETSLVLFQGVRTCGSEHPTSVETQKSDEVVKRWKRRQMNSEGRKLNSKTVIPVHWHVITAPSSTDGNGKEEGLISDNVISEAIEVLNNAYAPDFSFELRETNHKSNDAWFYGNRNDGKMKKELRQGGCDTLNIYSYDAVRDSLGYATFPWKCKSKHGGTDPDTEDGVAIDYRTVPGGNLVG